jgi:hypothetical protein
MPIDSLLISTVFGSAVVGSTVKDQENIEQHIDAGGKPNSIQNGVV